MKSSPTLVHGSLALLVLAACGSEVSTSGAGGGSTSSGVGGDGGAGGSANVSTTASTSTSSASTSEASTTTGVGGGPCEQACAKVEMCFGTGCAAAGIDCTDPQYDCIGLCVLDASCADLLALAQNNPPPELAACVSACQGGDATCNQCLLDSSCTAGCMDDPNCQDWGQCALACSTPDCFDACDTQYPDAAASYGPIYDCACTSCTAECETVMDPCGQGTGGMGAGGMGGGGMGASTGSTGGSLP
jgi:hypothetical protein